MVKADTCVWIAVRIDLGSDLRKWPRHGGAFFLPPKHVDNQRVITIWLSCQQVQGKKQGDIMKEFFTVTADLEITGPMTHADAWAAFAADSRSEAADITVVRASSLEGAKKKGHFFFQ